MGRNRTSDFRRRSETIKKPMKTEQQIAATRLRIIDGVARFAAAFDFPLSMHEATAEQVHFLMLGALAFADDVLELYGQTDNMGAILAAMDKANDDFTRLTAADEL